MFVETPKVIETRDAVTSTYTASKQLSAGNKMVFGRKTGFLVRVPHLLSMNREMNA